MSSQTVLIVDDEQPLRDMLESVLQSAGYRTVTAAHGMDALTLIARSTPDLVLSDVMMPLLGGTELCRRLKSTPSTQSIPVILMSGRHAPLTKVYGADAFLAKPFDLEEVECLVNFWIAHTDIKTRA